MSNSQNSTNREVCKKLNYPALFYIFSGIIVTIFLLLTINTQLLQFKIESAVVSVPLEPMTAPMAGFVSNIFVTNNTPIKKGDSLFKIDNIELEKELQLARLQADDVKVNVDYLQRILTNENQRLSIYQSIGSNRVASAQALVDISRQEFNTAKKNLERMKMLHKEHYISEANWDFALSAYNNAKEKLNSALAQMNLENNSLHSVANGMYFTGNKLEGKTKDISAELETAKNRLAVSLNRVKVYEDLVNRLTLKAPFDGKVVQVLKSPGNSIDASKTVLLLEEKNKSKAIIAYLTQNEVTRLRLDDEVKIVIPALNQTFRGKITDVNRTSGFIDEINAQYRWRDLNTDRSATVTIDISENEQTKFNEHVVSGMPAVVYFPRKLSVFSF